MIGPHIIVLSAAAETIAHQLKSASRGVIHGLEGRVGSADVHFPNTGRHVRDLFEAGETIIGVMAAGAMVRLLAPVLKDKRDEPPVVIVSDDGTSVVPLLGGHHGANQIARHLAEHLNGHAAITTAGDIHFGVALDEPPAGWSLANPDLAKTAMASLLAGEQVRLDDSAFPAPWLKQSALPISDDGKVILRTSLSTEPMDEDALIYYPQSLVLGVGCERHASPAELRNLVEKTLQENRIAVECIACVVSLDVKADEEAVNELAHWLNVPARFFTAQQLEQETPRLKNPSAVVFAEVGCHGVAEAAALAMAGAQGELIVEKNKSKRATMAVACAPEVLLEPAAGRDRGHLSVVGIGPGSEDWRSPEVSRLVSASSDLVGYSLYLDLLGGLTEGKTRHDFDLGREEDRVRHAMELAGEGKNVALVCSGDAGIYAMATLVFELLENGGLSDPARRISIQVSPGISALQGAAARAGAPLGHDFCTISLSDLLTPWEAIKRRVKAAAEGDFVIAFYNPVSKRRRTQLAYAKDVLLEHRPADTPVILATNLGREGEVVRVVPLSELEVDDVDMLTVVIVGSSETRVHRTGDGREWVYTPRGYADKSGTQIRSGT